MYKSHPLTITNLLGIPARIRLHPSRKDDVKLENVRIDEDMEVPEDKSTQQPAGYVNHFNSEAICSYCSSEEQADEFRLWLFSLIASLAYLEF